MTSAMVDANNTMIAENRAMYGNTLAAHTGSQHAAYSPGGASAKLALDLSKLNTPPPAFSGDAHDSANSSSNMEGASALSNKLLHEAFASLSLTDKCALSLSMSQINPDAANNSNKNSATNTPRTSKIGIGLSLSPLDSASLNNSTASAGNVDEISEIQSVLSETDKESLDVAMSMMGHLELRQVEDEVSEASR